MRTEGSGLARFPLQALESSVEQTKPSANHPEASRNTQDHDEAKGFGPSRRHGRCDGRPHPRSLGHFVLPDRVGHSYHLLDPLRLVCPYWRYLGTNSPTNPLCWYDAPTGQRD